MKTAFLYEGRIDHDKYWNEYMQREDAIRRLTPREEARELSGKSLVKEHLALQPVPAGQ